MMINSLRRLFWPSLMSALFVCGLIGLGVWQLQRLEWKQDLLTRIEAGLEAPYVTVPGGALEPDAWDYRRIAATGEFLHEYERHLYTVTPEGKPGYHILTPLKRRRGAWLLVNRGWVSEKFKAPETRIEGQVEGVVTVYGIARLSRDKTHFSPEDNPASNTYFTANITSLAISLPGELLPVILEADDTPNPGGWPKGGVTRIDIPNDHLGYAITWFSLAGVVIVLFALFVRRSRDRDVALPQTRP